MSVEEGLIGLAHHHVPGAPPHAVLYGEDIVGYLVLMPCMAFACGLAMLDAPDADQFLVGAFTDDDWAKVTCSDCAALGLEQVVAEIHRQQGRQAVIER